MAGTIQIGGIPIGEGHPAYIVAEMSGNHGQSFDQAARIVEAAKGAGADAVKIQTYTADTITIRCDKKCFRVEGTLWDGRTLYDLYQQAHTPWDWQPKLMDLARDLGIHLFSTPFDETAVDFLEPLNPPAHKIASFEMIDTALLKKVARTGRPVIMSTGMAQLGEIDEAVSTLREAGCAQLALMKCTSAYPAPPEEMNLRTIPHLAEAFGTPVGLSDHSMGISVPVAAVSLGASIIEKHFTLSRSAPGPDTAFSLEPEEFKAMVQAVRTAEKALGGVRYQIGKKEAESKVFRRSLFVVQDMKAGAVFTPENVRSIRPGDGLPPKHLDAILGRRATRDVERGTPLSWDLVGGGDHD
jgi:pseudaminic acid synthase